MLRFFRNRIRSTFPDEEMILLYAKKRDVHFAEELFSRYSHLVFGVCYKFLKEEEASKDAVMQIFEKILAEPPQQEIRSFRNWLFVVTKNHCLMELRHERAETRAAGGRFLELKEEIMEFPEADHLAQEMEKEKIFSKLRNAIDRLGTEQRTCIELFYLEGKSYAEISALTGFDMNAVKSHLQNGIRNLKNMISHD